MVKYNCTCSVWHNRYIKSTAEFRFGKRLKRTMSTIINIIVLLSFASTHYAFHTKLEQNFQDLLHDLNENIKELINKPFAGQRYFGDVPFFPASSCGQLTHVKPDAKSGLYWIHGPSGAVKVYCEMDLPQCGNGTWTRISNLNMSKNSASCPPGLEKPRVNSLCRKNVSTGCSSVVYSTHNVPYTKVCGRVIGIQYNSLDAFKPFFFNRALTIDDAYVDGVSLTYGFNPRHHIWTFAAAADSSPSGPYHFARCPCTLSTSITYNHAVPSFVKNDYSCETGSNGVHYSNQYYYDDPLWDARGCSSRSTCCEGRKKPWFINTFSEPISSELEIRVCADEDRNNEDILIREIYLYVQ